MYKFNENNIIEELKKYIDETYDEHYATGKIQTTEFVVDNGHGTGFCVGNMLKYTQRYGKKGTPKDWRKDLFKVIHYAIIQTAIHDAQHDTVKNEGSYKMSTKIKYEDMSDIFNSYEESIVQDYYNKTIFRSLDEATPQEWNRAAKAISGEKS